MAAAPKTKDTFSCSNCCQHFTLKEAESHFRSRMHFNGNVVKCCACEDTVGAKVKSYPDFLKYYNGHQCSHVAAAAPSTSKNSNNQKRAATPPGGGGGTRPNSDDKSDSNAKKAKRSEDQSPHVEGARPPGLLVSGRDCIEIEIDSD